MRVRVVVATAGVAGEAQLALDDENKGPDPVQKIELALTSVVQHTARALILTGPAHDR